MYTLYQSVSRIPLPSRLSAAHLPPGGRFVGRETRPLQPDKWQFIGLLQNIAAARFVIAIWRQLSGQADKRYTDPGKPQNP